MLCFLPEPPNHLLSAAYLVIFLQGLNSWTTLIRWPCSVARLWKSCSCSLLNSSPWEPLQVHWLYWRCCCFLQMLIHNWKAIFVMSNTVAYVCLIVSFSETLPLPLLALYPMGKDTSLFPWLKPPHSKQSASSGVLPSSHIKYQGKNAYMLQYLWCKQTFDIFSNVLLEAFIYNAL